MKPHEQGISIVTCHEPENMTHRALPLGKQSGCRMYQMPCRRLKTYLRMTTQREDHRARGWADSDSDPDMGSSSKHGGCTEVHHVEGRSSSGTVAGISGIDGLEMESEKQI